MTGQELYEIWVDAMRRQSVDVAPWHELDIESRAAWQATAREISE